HVLDGLHGARDALVHGRTPFEEAGILRARSDLARPYARAEDHAPDERETDPDSDVEGARADGLRLTLRHGPAEDAAVVLLCREVDGAVGREDGRGGDEGAADEERGPDGGEQPLLRARGAH